MGAAAQENAGTTNGCRRANADEAGIPSSTGVPGGAGSPADVIAWTDMARQLETVGRFCRLMSQRRARYALSRAEVAVLTHLELAGCGVTPGDVGRETGIGKEAMSRLARGLVERGLIERSAHPRDGRSVLLHVTPAGKDELERMYGDALRPLYAMLRGLGPADYGRLMELLRRAGDMLEGDVRCSDAARAQGGR